MRSEIRQLIEDIEPCDELEREHRQNALQWINSGADLFRIEKPATPPKHLVAYFVVIDPQKKLVLLVDHLKAKKWLPSGGHVDLNEHPRDTVIREASEELALDASFLYDGTFFITETVTVGLTAGHTDVSLWFVIKGDQSRPLNFDATEFAGVRWFSYEEILTIDTQGLDPHMHRFLRKWMSRSTI